MRDSIRRMFLWGALLLILAVVAARAQSPHYPTPIERPDLFTTVQDSIVVSLGDDDGTISPNLVSGAYTFIMLYDSTCRVEYIFTEPWLNGQRLTLDHWFNERSVNAHENQLSFNSRTKGFRVATGDTVSFFRNIYWKHPITGRRDTTNYFSRDTLAYAVELVKISTMTRLALIDSICVMPQMPAGKFRFYGHRNAMAVAKYAVPSSMNGDSVCMRVRVYARGSGDYYFTRYDNIKLNSSVGALRHPVMIADLALLQQCCWTPIPMPEQFGKSVGSQSMSGTAILSVRQPMGGRTEVHIELAPAPGLGEISIVIFDAQGTALPSPFSGTIDEARVIPYSFSSSGTYIIGVVQGGKLLESQKITITK